jgi:hypothetical protein
MKRIFLTAVFLSVVMSGSGVAQVPGGTGTDAQADTSTGFSLKKSLKENIKFSGEFGSSLEYYTVSGRPSQRPERSGRVYFRPTVSLYDRIILNLDLLMSTEGNSARQSMNTVGFSPEWSWGKLYYGDFSLQLSKFTLTDVNIKGYGVELYPGILRLTTFSGKTQEAIGTEASNSMYERTIYGGKLGIGDESGSHLHFNFLRVYDNKNSLPRDLFRNIETVTTAAGARVDTNYTGVTPQENMIGSIDWGLHLFNNAFKVKSELAISLFTKDLYSKALENSDIPKEVGQYYLLRSTSSGDFALSSEMAYSASMVNVKGGYTLVGPGYTSLGMGSMINDRQVINGALGLNLFAGNFAVQTNFQKQNDNVANQKLYTTDRNTMSFMASVRPLPTLSFALNSNVNMIGNNAVSDTVKVDILTVSYGLNSNYGFDAFALKHILVVGFSDQSFLSKNVIRGNYGINSYNINAGLNTAFSKQLTSNIMTTYSSVDAGPGGITATQTISGRVNFKMLNEKLINGLSYTLVNSDASVSNVLMFQAAYQLYEQSVVSFQTRGTFFKGLGPHAFSFNEYSSTLDWSYRF